MIRKLFLFAFPLAVVAAACGGDDSSVDAGAPPADAGKEAAACPHACTPCASPTNMTCFFGAAGKVCQGPGGVQLICPADNDAGGSTTWSCKPGTIPADQCGCSTATYPTLKPGDDCPMGQDASVADTSTE